MVTRSGTNRLSGTLFYFDRRPEYNANEWENNIDELAKRHFTQYIPGSVSAVRSGATRPSSS